MNLKVPDHIFAIRPYSTGRPIEEVARETGAGRIIKLASNENPLGPSPAAVRAVREAIGSIHRYPDGGAHALVSKLSRKLSVPPNRIVIGNGSEDLIGMLTRLLAGSGEEVILGDPSFLIYDIVVRSAGAIPVHVPLKSLAIDLDGFLARITGKTRMVFVCNPNNPTGGVVSRNDFDRFLSALPESVVAVLDEAYAEFVRDPSAACGMDCIEDGRPLVVLRTFSKAYGLAGLRIGYGVMPAEIVDLLHRIRLPFNTNLLGQAAAAAALDDTAFLEKTVRITHEGLDYFYQELDRAGIPYFPTQTNFFLIDVGRDADAVFHELLTYGVIVRSMTPNGFATCIRVNVGLPDENAFFIEALKKVLARKAYR